MQAQQSPSILRVEAQVDVSDQAEADWLGSHEKVPGPAWGHIADHYARRAADEAKRRRAQLYRMGGVGA